jgi:hypothetical protein
MNRHEWTWKCAEALHLQWPRVDRVDLEHLAEALYQEPRWSVLAPELAAQEWLRQGIPTAPALTDDLPMNQAQVRSAETRSPAPARPAAA